MKTFLQTIQITAISTFAFCALSGYAQNFAPQALPQQIKQNQQAQGQFPQMAAPIPQLSQNSSVAGQAQQPPDDRVSFEYVFPQILPDKGKIGLSFLEQYWGWLLAIAVASALAAYIIFRPKKTPPKSPFEIAMDAISYTVANSNGLTEKEYASQISLAVRAYIESEHKIPAPVKTTQEFLKLAAKSIVFDKDEREMLSKILNISDMAKFARNQFSDDERTALADTAKKFLEADKLRCEMKRDISNESECDDIIQSTAENENDISVDISKPRCKKISSK